MHHADRPGYIHKRKIDPRAVSKAVPARNPQPIRNRETGRRWFLQLLPPLILVFTFNFLTAEAALNTGYTAADLDTTSLLTADYGAWASTEMLTLRQNLIQAVQEDCSSGNKDSLAQLIATSGRKTFLISSGAQEPQTGNTQPQPVIEESLPAADGDDEIAEEGDDAQLVVVGEPEIRDEEIPGLDMEEVLVEAREVIEVTRDAVGGTAGGGGLLSDPAIQEQLETLRDLRDSIVFSGGVDLP